MSSPLQIPPWMTWNENSNQKINIEAKTPDGILQNYVKTPKIITGDEPKFRNQKSFHMCWEMRSLTSSPLRCPPRMSYFENSNKHHQQRSKETGWSWTPNSNSKLSPHVWALRIALVDELATPILPIIVANLKFKQKHQHRIKHNGWNSTTPCRSPGKMVMNPNFGTRIFPTCVSTKDCTHYWWAHHSEFPQGYHELYFTATTSKHHQHQQPLIPNLLTHLLVPNLPSGALWDPNSVRLKLFLRLTVPESFVGSCHLRPDWRIGKLLRYPTTGKWNFRRPQSSFNTFKWPRGSWIRDARFGSPLRLTDLQS